MNIYTTGRGPAAPLNMTSMMLLVIVGLLILISAALHVNATITRDHGNVNNADTAEYITP